MRKRQKALFGGKKSKKERGVGYAGKKELQKGN